MPLILKNAPDVKFREIAHIFIADFERPSFAKEAEKITDKAQPATGKATGKANDLQSFLRRQSEATIPEMAAELGLTEDGINYRLRKLQKAGKLKRIGGRKKGHWRVVG